MPHMKPYLLASGLCVVLASAGPARAQAMTADELAAAVRRGSDEYLRAVREYQAESTSVSTMQGSGAPLVRARHRCRQAGPCQLLVTTDQMAESGPEPDRAIGLNTRYAFELRRSPGKGWTVVSFHDLASGPPPDLFRHGGANDPVARMVSPYWLEGRTWLPDVLARPGLKLRQVERTAAGGEPRVVVRYEYDDPDRPGLAHAGTVTLDPERYWVVASYDHSGTINGVTKRTVRTNQFDVRPDGLPLLREARGVVTSTLPAAAGKGREDTLTFSLTREVADPMEFTLTAFGLPEPPGVKWERPTPRWVWAVAAAGGFGLLAALFRRLARRSAARAQAVPQG